jgi:hypothetical protein
VSFNGGMKEEATQHLFPCSGGGRRQPWWRCEVGNGGSGAYSAQLEVEEVSWADWAKKAEWASATAWAGWADKGENQKCFDFRI